MFVYLVHQTLYDLEQHDEVLEVHAALPTAKRSLRQRIGGKPVWHHRSPKSKRDVHVWTITSPTGSYGYYISKERVL